MGIVFDVEGQAILADIAAPAHIPSELLQKQMRVCGVASPPAAPEKLLFWGHDFLLAVEPKKCSLVDHPKHDEELNAVEQHDKQLRNGFVWRTYKGFNHILALCALDEAQ